MPEIVLQGLRHVGSGVSESDSAMLEEMRQNAQIKLWAFRGTEEECESAWRSFLLEDMPEGSTIW